MNLVHQLCLVAFWSSGITAVPTLDFPVNAQVPPVARVSQPYAFQFALTTFGDSASGSTLTYSLESDAPAWLQLDSTSHTFSGTPTSQDIGPSSFGLTAADDSGNATMQVTLTVVDFSVPSINGNVTAQLSQQGLLSGPNTLALYTGSGFDIQFPATMFSPVADPLYYATCADRSPLPSWMIFDPSSITFSGSAPPLLSSPQLFGFRLYISRVEGFEEASVDFTLEASSHELGFTSVERTIHVGSNAVINYQLPVSELLLDGSPITENDIATSTAQLPTWLEFQPSNFTISGQFASDVTSQEVNITVIDVYGDVATATVIFDFLGTIFAGTIGTINATAGTYFTYTISRSIFSTAASEINVTFPSDQTWLHFNASNLTLQGLVPAQGSSSIITAAMHAQPGTSSVADTQIFYIRVQGPINSTSAVQSHTTSSFSTSSTSTAVTAVVSTLTTSPSILTTSSASSLTTATDAQLQPELSKGASAGIGVACGLALLLITGALIPCLVCRKRGNSSYGSDSAPFVACFGRRRRRRQRDLEKLGGSYISYPQPVTDPSYPPQLDDRILGFYTEDGSSIGRHSDATELHPADEATLRVMNRTSLGTDAVRALQYPSQIARSRESLLIRPGRASRPPYDRKSTSLGISRASWLSTPPELGGTNGQPRGSHRFSTASDLLHNQRTSYLRLPQRLTAQPGSKRDNMARSWIRCVSQTSDMASHIDTRPLAERRQSYIKRRASSNQGNPLFAAGTMQRQASVGGRRTPLGIRSNNSQRLRMRSLLTRSKSSSVGVSANRLSGPAGSRVPTEHWETESSSSYSDRDFDRHDDDRMDIDSPEKLKEEDLDEERENRRQKLSRRLGRDSRGDLLESVFEDEAAASLARRAQVAQVQKISPLKVSSRHVSMAGNRDFTARTDASSIGPAFI